MGCPDEETLIAAVERGLPGFADLEVHLDSCEQCRKVLAAAATSRTLAMGTPAGDVAEKLEALVDVSIGGRYRVEALLGRGGMGTVYLARDLTLNREVALKLHRAGSSKDRLHREALAMAKLAHPNVVTVFEVGELEDRMYVAMEYVRGTTLRGWLEAEPRAWREIILMLLAAGEGLAAAHAAGLVHRDFKPENVLVGDDGRARVGDFGLARVGAGRDSVPPNAAAALTTAMTQTGALVGTPAYMAPEQLAGETVDARCDQFAFSVVAWELLYGRRPFAGATIEALMDAITHGELQRGDGDVPERVRDVLERGLAIDPKDRYENLPALLGALRAAAAPRTKRRAIFAAAGALAVIAIAVPSVAAVQSRRRDAACAREADATRAVFDDATRTQIARAFAATGTPYAATAADRASDVLARSRDALAIAREQACRADEPRALADARRACLDEHERALASLVDTLAHADAASVDRAPGAAWAVYAKAPCSDDRALLARPAATAASSPEHAHALSHFRALMAAGKFREARAVAEPLVAAAHAANDRPLELAALIAYGDALRESNDHAKLAATLQQALALAEALGRDGDAAKALNELANLAGTVRHDFATAHRDIDLARAKLERIGDTNSDAQGALAITESRVLLDENRLGEAETTLKRAIAILEQADGADHPKLGSALGTLADIELSLGKLDDSYAAAQRSVAICSRALGDGHLNTGNARMTLAAALIAKKRYDEARTELKRADEVFVHALGPDHLVRAGVFGNLGGIERELGHWDAALADFRSALAIIEHAVGPASPDAADARRDVARVLALSGHTDDAIAEQQRVIAILDKLGPDGEPYTVSAYTDLASFYLDAHRPTDALAAAQRALALANARPADANPGELAAARDAVTRAYFASALLRR